VPSWEVELTKTRKKGSGSPTTIRLENFKHQEIRNRSDVGKRESYSFPVQARSPPDKRGSGILGLGFKV